MTVGMYANATEALDAHRRECRSCRYEAERGRGYDPRCEAGVVVWRLADEESEWIERPYGYAALTGLGGLTPSETPHHVVTLGVSE